MAEDQPKLTCLGKIVILLVILLSLGGAGYLLIKPIAGLFSRQLATAGSPGSSSGNATASHGPAHAPGSAPTVGSEITIGVAYGTEKRLWLEWAVQEFAKTPVGKRVHVDLIPMGSVEGANAILKNDGRIHVWTPASSVYKDVFVRDWPINHSGQPIVHEERLALSPMVFVWWQERHDAFSRQFPDSSFKTIAQAVSERSGWQALAGKPEWGLFKFGHTNPNESNSGLMTLLLMAYEFHGKNRDLKLADILDPKFQAHLRVIESGVTGMSNSTGNMMREMVLKGPSTFDVLFVYENLAIDYLKIAEGRSGRLHVAYPPLNMWNDNPYYILNASWCTPAHQAAAREFLDFLMSEPIQRQSLIHGFRPGDPKVAINMPDSPFMKYQASGLKIELSTVCDPPTSEVITNLLATWQRARMGN